MKKAFIIAILFAVLVMGPLLLGAAYLRQNTPETETSPTIIAQRQALNLGSSDRREANLKGLEHGNKNPYAPGSDEWLYYESGYITGGK